jgi:hypothetical protein
LGPSRHEQGRQQILCAPTGGLADQTSTSTTPSDEQRNYTVDDPEAYLYYKAFFTTTTDDEDVLRFGTPPAVTSMTFCGAVRPSKQTS